MTLKKGRFLAFLGQGQKSRFLRKSSARFLAFFSKKIVLPSPREILSMKFSCFQKVKFSKKWRKNDDFLR